MNSRQVFPAALLLLFCLVDSGAGLKCYQCNSYEHALCADPFHFDDTGEAKSGNEFLLDCPKNEPATDDKPAKNYFCRKIYQNVRGDERVIRSCGYVEDERKRACYTTVLEEYNTVVCACGGNPKRPDEKDGCNSAYTSSISVMAILSSVVLGYLIH